MEIVGHETIRNKLKQQVEQEKVGHAYLFSGKMGIGKKMVALEFARNMMCLSPINGQACGSCEACFTFGNTSDFSLIEPDGQSIKVDVIRSLQEEIFLKPTHAKRKCIIINDADTMNESAQNALLKVLEEPPIYASIILVTSSEDKLLKTIQSRVVKEVFMPLSYEELQRVLGVGFDSSILPYAGGSVSKALKLSNDDEISIAQKMVQTFSTKDMLKINQAIEQLKESKSFKTQIIDILDTIELVCYQKRKENIVQYTNYIQIIEDTKNKILKNANVDLTLDHMMVQICYE